MTIGKLTRDKAMVLLCMLYDTDKEKVSIPKDTLVELFEFYVENKKEKS